MCVGSTPTMGTRILCANPDTKVHASSNLASYSIIMKTLKYCGLSKREFYGEDFYKFLISEFETSRVFLKNCGRPKDEYDRFLISEAKFTSSLFKRMINEDE